MTLFAGEFQILFDAIFYYFNIIESKHICSLELVSYLNNKYKRNFPVDVPFKNDVYCWLYSLNQHLKSTTKYKPIKATEEQIQALEYILKTQSIC